jgi:hypothetical protein
MIEQLICSKDKSRELLRMFQGQHHYGLRFQQQQKHILIHIQFVEDKENLFNYINFQFSTKIQQKL